MPNRIIRADILTSEAVSSLGWAEEVFYRRLMSIVDDYGRHEANVQLLRSKCYPLQTDAVRVADISRWMAACQKAGLIAHYEVQGKQYVEIAKFGQQTRTPSRCPPPPTPDGGLPSADSKCNQALEDARLGVFGDGDVEDPPPPGGGGFERFWNAWPNHRRKVARDQCLRKWVAKGCEAIADAVVAAVEAEKASEQWRKEGGQFIPAPLVWLNQARWEAPTQDDLPITVPSAAAEETAAYIRQQQQHAATLPPVELLARRMRVAS